MQSTKLISWVLGSLIVLLAAEAAWAAEPLVVVAGRRDPRLIVISLERALDPSNNGTANAVIARVRVTRNVDTNGDGTLDTPASGLPSNVVVAPGGRTALVVNHAGNATPAQTNTFQHGHLGTIAVVDLGAALNPANNNTTNAISALIPTGFWGPVGVGLSPNGKFALVANSESQDKEDGAREISVIDLEQEAVTQATLLALGNGGKVAQDVGKSCPELVANPALLSKSLPNPNFGCFPASNALGVTRHHGGFAFTANGGTDDVSVIDVDRAIAGEADAEVARIPVELGPWGLAVSPNGKLISVTNRESAETGVEGNTISIIDAKRAIGGDTTAEVARVRVGTDAAAVSTRPFGLNFT
ncbi:MAG: hypothetical protein H0U63_06465, partial [Burkholderiales bacterium]|nr:hypothetical protein [Burkholderiales bacterium]